MIVMLFGRLVGFRWLVRWERLAASLTVVRTKAGLSDGDAIPVAWRFCSPCGT
jgi:hypothetical protein